MKEAPGHRALFSLLDELLARAEYERLGGVYADDVVAEFPQSGERFRGLESLRGQFVSYPSPEPLATQFADVIGGTSYALTPMYTVIAVEGSGDRGTAIFRTRYPDGSYWWVLSVYELAGERISRLRTFFAAEFEPPAWREPYWDKS